MISLACLDYLKDFCTYVYHQIKVVFDPCFDPCHDVHVPGSETDLPDLVMTISVVSSLNCLHSSPDSSSNCGESDGAPDAVSAGDRRGNTGVGRRTPPTAVVLP